MAKAKRSVRPFKVHSFYGRVVAWCSEPSCHWRESAEGSTVDKNAIPRTYARAKRHAEETGHETRIDRTQQRGYRAVK